MMVLSNLNNTISNENTYDQLKKITSIDKKKGIKCNKCSLSLDNIGELHK